MLFSGVAWLIGCASLSHVPQAQQMAQRPSAYPLGIISAGYAPEFHMADSLRDRWHGVKEATAVNTVLVAPLMAECLATAAAPGPWFGLSPAFCLPLLAIFIPGLDSLGNKGVLEKLESVERDIVRQINGSDTQSALAGAVARYLQSIGNGADLVVVSDIPGPQAPHESPQYSPGLMQGYASMLELGMQKFEFSGSGKKGSLPCMFMQARARLIDAGSGQVMDELNYRYRAACYSAEDWLAEEGRRMSGAILNGYRFLVENIVDEMLLIYHPGKSADKSSQPDTRGPVPHFVLAPVDPPAPEMGIKWGNVFSFSKKPGGAQGFGGMQFRDVVSLTPRFAWEKFPRAFDQNAVDGGYSDVVYDLRIYSGVISGLGTIGPLHLVQELTGLTEPAYRVEQPLDPCSWYFWTVRARFNLNGTVRSTEWGGAYKTLGGNFFPSYSRRHGESPAVPWPATYLYYPFRTPNGENSRSCWR